MIKKIAIAFSLISLIACNNSSAEEEVNIEKTKISTVKEAISKTKNSKYLSKKELVNYINKAKLIEVKNQYKTPFDTLKFDKVIAYDFDGSEEPYPSVVSPRDSSFVPVILHQKELDIKQVDNLTKLLTDNTTYGGITAACFQPHMGIIFYHNNKINYIVNICLDCNYLIASTQIPAQEFTKAKYEDGTPYSLVGFSKKGKEKIIELSKSLDLDYGDYVITEFP